MTGFLILLILIVIILTGHLMYRRGALPIQRLESNFIPLSSNYKNILNKHFGYYNHLSIKDKRIFEQKVKRFMVSKQFVSRQFPKVTDEMKVLISAAAVQLTFGLPGVFLRHFNKIVIYSDSYYSTINKKYHKGEVNPAYGIIVLSWKNFVEGYSNPQDSLNLGIHEMAHALHLENVIINGEHNFFDQQLLHLWENLVQREISVYRSTGAHFFREYAYTDEHEFFAVASENFFENPVKFSEEKPDLYFTLAGLLNQDPLKLYA